MRRRRIWLFAATSLAIGVLVVTHTYFFLHLPPGVSLVSGAGFIAVMVLIKVLLARIGLHGILRRIH